MILMFVAFDESDGNSLTFLQTKRFCTCYFTDEDNKKANQSIMLEMERGGEGDD